jgi:uncharacterized protein YqeY
MTILTTLQDEMKIAMKARDQVRLDALRLLVSAIKYAEVDSPNLTDEQIGEVLKKEAKKRREAIEAYQKAGRTESAEKEQYELTMIEAYLPKMMSEDEVREKVLSMKEQVVSKNMGEAMKLVMGELKGQAEGGVVSKVVKEILAEK